MMSSNHTDAFSENLRNSRVHLKGVCVGLTDSKVLLPDLDNGGFSCFLCILCDFSPLL